MFEPLRLYCIFKCDNSVRIVFLLLKTRVHSKSKEFAPLQIHFFYSRPFFRRSFAGKQTIKYNTMQCNTKKNLLVTKHQSYSTAIFIKFISDHKTQFKTHHFIFFFFFFFFFAFFCVFVFLGFVFFFLLCFVVCLFFFL